MRVAVPNLPPLDLGITETTPTVGITDYSRRVTDDFGVTSVTKRGFSRKLSLRFAVPFGDVDALQTRLAGLRETKATWIADDRFRALSVVGRYKDFLIDVASQPCSFCTLTIDGFAETLDYPDTGGDPAVDGASTFRLLQPVTVNDVVLRASSVPEDDAPAWSAGGTYAKGERVLVGHRVYESLIDGNVGHAPATTAQWLDAAPTNRFAMFDQALGSETMAPGSIVVTLSSVNATALALLDVTGATIQVQGAGYDQQRSVDGTMIFDGLPAGDITVTVTGPGTVAIGTLLFGRIVALGVTETNPTVEIADYSRKETDDFGEVTIVPRAWAKRMAARTMLRTDAVDLVFDRIATVRALPSLWIGDDGTDALCVYGFFKDFSIEVGETTSKLSLQIEGLSKAAKVKGFGAGGPVEWSSIVGAGKPEDYATRGMTAAERQKYEGIAEDIADIFSDGILHRGPEKLTLLRIYDDLIADSAAAHAQSVALSNQYGGDPTLTERVARDTAIGALDAYLNGLAPPWSQVDVDTPANGYDIRDRFGAARQTTADLARANDAFVAARAKAALDQLIAIGSDGVLSKGEKQSAIIEWNNTYTEGETLTNRWKALGSPGTIKAVIDAHIAAVTALAVYLGGLRPQWDDVSVDTPIDAATWRSTWQGASAALGASRSALYGYTATTAQWDGVDNKPYSRLFTNLLDTMPWVPGAKDSIGRFSQNGGSGQNEIVLDQGPGGISEPILRMVANPGQGSVPGDNAGSPCGGWNYDAYKDRGEYDPRKTYRYMVWAKRAPGANGPIYLGTGGRILTVEGVADINPYFWVGDFEGDGQNNLPVKGKWYLIVGVLHGCDYTGGQSGISGVYDPDTGKRLIPGNDFKSHPEATLLVHRAYQYYAQAGSTSFFARPSLEEVTSATVSVEQIFATVGMTTLQAAALAEAQNAIIAIGSDAVLSKGEKERTVRDYVALSNETDTLHDRFVALGSPAEATDAINALITARDNLGGYLNTLSPPWSDATQDTPIDPPTWANRWDVAYDRLAKARAAITGRKGDKGDKGDDGANPLTAYLTNESFTHPTNAAGAPVEIAGGIGDGQMRVFLGTQDVTPQCSFTAQLPYNLALTVDQFGSYVSTALYDDQGYAFVIASYQGLAISKRVSASRSKGGTDGTSPPIVRVIASDQSFSLDTAGNAKAKTVRLTAAAQNTSAQVLWAAFRADGHQYTSWLDAATLAAQGWLTRSIDNLNVEIDQDTFNFLANNYGETITFGVLLQGTDVSDRVSIVRLRDGAKGADGAAGLAVFLTNPSHTVPANSTGTVTSYAGSAFSIVVMAGGENVTSSFSIESTDNPQGLSVPGAYPNYYVDGGLDASEATAVFTFNLIGSGRFANVRLSTVYSIGKSIAGANGAAPPLLTVQASGQAIVTNADGSLVTNVALTFSATRQNTDAAVTWAVFDGAGTQHRTYSGLSFTTDAADLLAIINYPAAVGQPNTRFCTVKAACGSVSDFVTVWAVRNGENGAPGVSPFALDLGSAAIVLNATYAGVTKPGQLPRNVAVSVKQGTTDAIGAVAIGISTSTGIAASYANGVVSITTADADGYVEVSASQGGVNVVAPKRISISRSLDAPPPQTATGVTQRGYNGDPNNTSYLSGPSGKIVTVGVPANGVLPIEIYLEYSVLENQSFAFRTYAAAAKIVYRPVGSGAAWSDLISEVSGTIAQWSRSTQEYEQGELNYPSSVNLPGGQAFEFALMVRKHSGNGSAQYVDGFMRIGE